MTPNLSIILTTFKRPQLLPRALASIIQQAHDGLSIQLLVCDDDPDGSAKPLVEKFKYPQDLEIRYIKREPSDFSGVAASRNRGLAKAEGDYVLFLDDDDELLPNAARSILGHAARTGADLCAGAYTSSTRLNEKSAPKIIRHTVLGMDVEGLKIGNQLCIGSYIIRRARVEHIFDKRLKSHEDWLFLLDNIFLNTSFVSVEYTDIEMVLVHIDRTKSSAGHRNPESQDQQTSKSYAIIYSLHPSEKYAVQRIAQLSKFHQISLENLLGAEQPEWPTVIRTRMGRFLICNPEETIQNSLLTQGTFEHHIHLSGLAVAQLKSGLIIDVGANIGTFTIPTALALNGRQFVAIEPQQNVHRLLNSNLLLNRLDHVATVLAAIGDPEKSGSYVAVPEFSVFSEKYTGSVSLSEEVQKIRSAIPGVAEPSTYARLSRTVPLISLDNLIGSHDVSLIKIDVEGMELDVIKSGKKAILGQKPSLLFECWNLPQFKDHCEKLLEFVKQFGYRLFAMGNDYLAVHQSVADESRVHQSLKLVGIDIQNRPVTHPNFAGPSFYRVQVEKFTCQI